MVEDAVEMENMHAADEGEEGDDHDPLIVGQEDEQRTTQHKRSRITLRNAGGFVWLLTCSAGISGLLFGYDTGVISSTLVSIGSDLSDRGLTTADKSVITAITSLFALLFAPLTGYLADRYGRRFVILFASLLFMSGALVQAGSHTVWLMAGGRGAVGAAVGLASCATPLYITEMSPAELRGRMVTIQSLFITGGQVVAYFLGWLLSQYPHGWRWMVGLGAAPAALQLFLIVFMFETPRWLVQADRQEKARIVLQKVYGGLARHDRDAIVDSVLKDVHMEIAEEAVLGEVLSDAAKGDTTIWTTAKHLVYIPRNRRALMIACMLQGLQQLCGFNSLMYFSATIFAMTDLRNPILISLTVAGTNFVLTVFAFAFIDTLGRRFILLLSIPFMIVGLVISSIAFQTIAVLQPGLSLYPDHSAWPGILIGAILLYVGAYAIGLGCVPWQQSELFPLRVRSLGSAIATATNWSSNFIIGVTFLPMTVSLGTSTAFALYAGVCVVGWVMIWQFYPETAGLELEGVGELLKDGWGVKESIRGFHARKAEAKSRS